MNSLKKVQASWNIEIVQYCNLITQYFQKLIIIWITKHAHWERFSEIMKWANKISLAQITAYRGAVTVTTFLPVISILITLFSLLLFKLEFLHELIYCSWFPFFLFLWPLLFLCKSRWCLTKGIMWTDWGDHKNTRNVLTFFSGSFMKDGGKKDGTYLE
jgi:hypothetical protein